MAFSMVASMLYWMCFAMHVAGLQWLLGLGPVSALAGVSTESWLVTLVACGVAALVLRSYPMMVSRGMFWLGERAGTGTGKRAEVDEVTEEEAQRRIQERRFAPMVVRGFQQPIAFDDIVAATDVPVPTHSYDSEIRKETMKLSELKSRIDRGETTNAKTVHEVFQGEKGRQLLERCVDTRRVDILRGTTGMPWTELAAQLFVGGPGTYTRSHADPSLNCYLMVAGRKRWRLSPPGSAPDYYVLPRGRNVSYNSLVLNDEDHRYPAYDRADKLEVILEPGDLLIVPPFWFHDVLNLEMAVGIALNWLSVDHAWCQNRLMTAGSLLSFRHLFRYLWPTAYPVDDDLMRGCRHTCGHCPPPTLRVEKTHRQQKKGRWLPAIFAALMMLPTGTQALTPPISVNYFIHRTCNMKCKFCFHTAKTTTALPLDDAKRGIKLLADSGMKKLNIAGGEPFLRPDYLGKLFAYAKELGVSTSVISNGSLITRDWLKKYGWTLDVLGVSLDSFNPVTNAAIGRTAPGLGGEDHIAQIFKVRDWAASYDIRFKLNTVVNTMNHREDMNDPIRKLDPFRSAPKSSLRSSAT